MIEFLGFENPKTDLNAHHWHERLEALSNSNNIGKWAKYGPFASRKSAQNKASDVRKIFRGSEYAFTHELECRAVQSNDKGYLYIKLTEL